MNIAINTNENALKDTEGRRVYEYKRAPWKRICEELGDWDWSWIRSSDVDVATGCFTRAILEVIEALVPSNPLRQSHCEIQYTKEPC